MSPRTFISLGVDCRVKYQIFLEQNRQNNHERTKSEINRLFYASNRDSTDIGTFFFDWLISPVSAVTSCFEADFANVFERDDLEVQPNGNVRNRRNGIVFQHNFSRGDDGKVTSEKIDAEYETQLQKIHYLAGKMRRLASSQEVTTYIRVGGTDQEAIKLSDAIAKRYPHHRFDVALVRLVEESGREFTSLSKRVTAYTMNREIAKDASAAWQGDDLRWGWFFEDLAARDADHRHPANAAEDHPAAVS